VSYSGQTSDTEIAQFAQEGQADERFTDLRYVLHDFTKCPGATFSTDSIQELAAIDSAASASNDRIKLAVVTDRDDVIAMVSAYLNSGFTGFELRVFPTVKLANVWLRRYVSLISSENQAPNFCPTACGHLSDTYLKTKVPNPRMYSRYHYVSVKNHRTKTLTKADLAEQLYKNVGLNNREAKEMVEAFFKEISDCLERGEEIKLAGFGVFNIRDKPERPGRNPKTGEEVAISARRVVTFHASSSLKEAVDASDFLAFPEVQAA
jgi:integration host factor subunit alpha